MLLSSTSLKTPHCSPLREFAKFTHQWKANENKILVAVSGFAFPTIHK